MWERRSERRSVGKQLIGGDSHQSDQSYSHEKATHALRVPVVGAVLLGATTLMDGGVRVPGGLRRLQSGWNERSSFGGFDSRPPPRSGVAWNREERRDVRNDVTDPVHLREAEWFGSVAQRWRQDWTAAKAAVVSDAPR